MILPLTKFPKEEQEQLRSKIKSLLLRGVTVKQAAKELGVSMDSVKSYKAWWDRKENTFSPLPDTSTGLLDQMVKEDYQKIAFMKDLSFSERLDLAIQAATGEWRQDEVHDLTVGDHG